MLNGASDRTHRITLRRPDIVADGYGGQKRAFSNYATRWAQVKPPAYREQQAQGAPMSREEIVVEITPADNAVGRGWRLLWQNHEYAVTTTDNTYRERTLITAKRLNPGE